MLIGPGRGGFLVIVVCFVAAWSVCLPEGKAERKDVQNSEGLSYPLGVNVGQDFQPVMQLINTLLKIIIEDVMGFNVVETTHTQARQAIFALAGCSDPDSLNVALCGNATRIHVAAATVVSEAVFGTLNDHFKDLAPIALGGMGYESFSSIHVPASVWQNAMDSEGLPLDFFRSFNASWFDPAKYFDTFDSIPKLSLSRCDEGFFRDVDFMADYVARTGDTDAVSNGTALCPDGYWFIAPSCRANTTRCVPLVVNEQRRALAQALQKSVAWGMPFAINQNARPVPSEVPLQHKVSFFWLQPMDVIYSSLNPYAVEFPVHDPAAFEQGDFRTMFRSSGVSGKYVSQDLQQLAPDVFELISSMTLPNSAIDVMVKDYLSSGDSQYDVACRWLLAHRDQWEKWVPDETVCLPGFGLFDSNTSEFLSHRMDGLTCIACASGRFSQKLFDDMGVTYICSPCPPGSVQPSGAATSCDACAPGEYQDQPRAISCKRCNIGLYQDQRGATACKNCTSDTTTVGFGSISELDCGCRQGYIETAREGLNPVCSACQTGLACPILSTLESLTTGASDLGADFVPALEEGYMSLEARPLEVFKCPGSGTCPGGLPGSCSGEAEGIACSMCQAGQHWQADMCQNCDDAVRVAWFVVVCLAMGGLPFSQVSRIKLKSRQVAMLVFVILCVWEMTLNLLQTLGIIGQMPLEWPMTIKWSFSFLEFFAFEITEFGYSCLVGESPLVQYSVQAMFVPALLLWVILVHTALKAVDELKWLRAEGGVLVLLLGQLVMMCFEAVSNFALVPFMCYRHPSGSYSNLQFASVLCGSQDHTFMVFLGFGLLALVLAFLSASAYALWRLPTWSMQGSDFAVTATTFLTDQFRADAWWFGLMLLLRGPVLSLIITLFTNEPATQILLISTALCLFLLVLLLTWPYKFPLLNALEAFSSWGMLLLVLGGSLYLPAADKNSMDVPSVATLLAAGLSVTAVFGAFILTIIKLVIFQLRGGSRKTFKLLYLGTPPEAGEIAEALVETADQLKSLTPEELEERLSVLSSFDSKLITACISMLSLEVLPRRTSKWLGGRIASQNSLVPGESARTSRTWSESSLKTSTSNLGPGSPVETSPWRHGFINEMEQQKVEDMVEQVF